ncbi:hypothetical protein [Bergeyella sp. RCAD1439]|uniref:hypothetical protein n=1 Tax=Bergeyella anatis TaxID=3113737 RepID=UPI002E19F3BD|nr:hypothetical protein [Bergeyella sp. RCAD1439]
MRLTKTKGFTFSLLSFVVGFVCNGLAWTVLPGPVFNTLALIVGFSLMWIGLGFFIASFWIEN